MSSASDVPVTVDDGGKEKMPKEKSDWGLFLGHAVNNCMTVIARWRAILGKHMNIS